MSTPGQKGTRWFASVKQLYQARAAKILLWGPWGTGKTYFLGTCPQPVYIFDTELGAAPVMWHEFPELCEQDRIKIAEVGVIDPGTLEINPELTLKNFESAMAEILPTIEPKATLAIDSGTVIWQTLGWWLDDAAEVHYKSGKMKGKFIRTEWGKANRRFYAWVMQLIQKKDLTVVITSHTQDVYDSEGNLSEPEGKMRINKQTPHWVDFVYHCIFRNVYETKPGSEVRAREEKRLAILEKCRFADKLKFKTQDREVENLTYPKMVEQLSRLGLLFQEDGTIDKGKMAKKSAVLPAKKKEKASWKTSKS